MMSYLWVAIGGALGRRFWCSGFVAQTVGGPFSLWHYAINVVSPLVIGIFATLTGPDGRLLVAPDVRTFVMIGLCGGYTHLLLVQPSDPGIGPRWTVAPGRRQHPPLSPPCAC